MNNKQKKDFTLDDFVTMANELGEESDGDEDVNINYTNVLGQLTTLHILVNQMHKQIEQLQKENAETQKLLKEHANKITSQ